VGPRHRRRGLAVPGLLGVQRAAGRAPAAGDLTCGDLVAEADRLQAGLDHRKVEFDDEDWGAPFGPGLRELGWSVDRLVWMLHDGSDPGPGPPGVRQVPRPEVHGLRFEWLLDDEMGTEAQIRDAIGDMEAVGAVRKGKDIVLAFEDQAYVALHVEPERSSGEVEDAYCTPSARGRGLGTGLLRAAIARAREEGIRDLWIGADADGRPRHLYQRLGFQPGWFRYEMVRRPR
jgi:GNAT superfamily N-acetyltransferase